MVMEVLIFNAKFMTFEAARKTYKEHPQLSLSR
jgi:hypothetical protein